MSRPGFHLSIPILEELCDVIALESLSYFFELFDENYTGQTRELHRKRLQIVEKDRPEDERPKPSVEMLSPAIVGKLKKAIKEEVKPFDESTVDTLAIALGSGLRKKQLLEEHEDFYPHLITTRQSNEEFPSLLCLEREIFREHNDKVQRLRAQARDVRPRGELGTLRMFAWQTDAEDFIKDWIYQKQYRFKRVQILAASEHTRDGLFQWVLYWANKNGIKPTVEFYHASHVVMKDRLLSTRQHELIEAYRKKVNRADSHRRHADVKWIPHNLPPSLKCYLIDDVIACLSWSSWWPSFYDCDDQNKDIQQIQAEIISEIMTSPEKEPTMPENESSQDYLTLNGHLMPHLLSCVEPGEEPTEAHKKAVALCDLHLRALAVYFEANRDHRDFKGLPQIDSFTEKEES